MMNRLIEDAERVAKGASTPTFTKNEYEDAMFKIAEDEAAVGESPAIAFSRLIVGRDPRMRALYKAARHVSSGRPSLNEVADNHEKKEHLYALMQKTARFEKRSGETEEQAFSRLIREDAEVRSSYELYRSL